MRKRRSKPPAKRPRKKVSSDKGYSVGWGRPPKKYQFKPGQSGNPDGKAKTKSPADSDALFENALNKKAKVEDGDRTTKLGAGFAKLADQFAEGDHRARRDVFDYAKTHRIDLTKRQDEARHVDASSDAELRKALLDRGIPARLLPPLDEAGLEPPPDPPLPPDGDEEPGQ